MTLDGALALTDACRLRLTTFTGSHGHSHADSQGGGDDDLLFGSMEGREGLSMPFHFEIVARSDRADLSPDALLGGSVTVTLDTCDDAPSARCWNGRVTRFEYLETGDDGRSSYRLTLRPWIWQLGLNADWRVFQNESVPDIATRIFRERGFHDFELALFDAYRPCEYVVQYGESDLHFVSRLLAREGIYYFFRHDDRKHTLVLADAPEAHDAVAGCERLSYAPRNLHRDRTRQYVRAWSTDARLDAGSVAVADFDFTKPRARLLSEARSADGHARRGDAAAEIYDYPAGFSDFASGDRRARVRFEQATLDRRAWRGESNARGLTVGARFDLSEHPRDDQNASYLVTSARLRLWSHESAAPDAPIEETFACSFRAIRSDVTFRPGRPVAPSARGPQTATVVGPAGQDIWTDRYGRVKVRFHWDREGRADENSSCWIRVAQAWAGKGWGAQFVPRVGQEVVVDFLDGDPDRPIITGSVYNAANAPPFDLPANRTQSGVRTRTSPSGGGGGGNEIRFEDRSGSEDLYVHAKNTLTTVVEGDARARLGGDRSTAVAGSENITVGVSRTAQIGNDDTTVVGVQHLALISPPGEGRTSSSITMTDKKIVLDTGAGAAIVLDHDKITITADVSITASDKLKILGKDVNIIGTSTAQLTGGSEVTVSGATATLGGTTANVTGTGTTNVSGGIVQINGPGLFAGRVTDPASGAILRGSSTVLIGGAPFPFDVTRDSDGNLHVGSAIVIEGDTAFQNKVLERLGQISNIPAGMQTLNSVESSGHTMNISEFKGDNSYCGPTTDEGFADATPKGQPVFRGAGKPVLGPDGKQMVGTGKGTDTDLQLNPDLTVPNRQDPSNPVPNDVVLFHEMTHGSHYMNGTRDGSPTPGFDTNEEKQTISTGSPSEADYLRERGYPYHRIDHSPTFVPNTP